ncbi:MAG: hypothetical protein GX649_14285 [Chloroflexi bacterium]|nr:hypothetical protein [Chloroflexota bacterium]
MDPLYIILIGLALVLIGVALPLLMVLDMLTPTYFLGFVSFTTSVGGVLLGLVGASRHRHGRGRRWD